MPLVFQNLKPRVVLGLMTFGPDEKEGARITSLDEFNKCLDYFQGQGYNEVDTARVYIGGKQEAFTAAAHWKERGLTLATKVYPDKPGAHRAEALKATFNESLKELQTDCVDIFYLHAADRSVPFAETLEAVNDLHKEGKFVQLGVSNYTAFELAEVVTLCTERGWIRPTIFQAMYNAISMIRPSSSSSQTSILIKAVARSIEAELIPACRRYGMDIVTYNPLAGGVFSGKYKSADAIPKEGRYSDAAGDAEGAMYRKRYFHGGTFAALELIEPVVKKHGLTLLETATRWIAHHSALKFQDGRDGVIVGVSSFSQLEGNLANMEKGPLPDEVVKVLDEAWLVAKATAPNYWQLDLEYTYDTQAALFGPKK